MLQSLVVYFLHERFGLGLDALGWIFFVAQMVTALSLLLAARFALRFGLLNTMVVSHLASNVFLIAIAFAPGAQDTMMVLALALRLDPVYVGAHHLTRFLIVTFSVAVTARRLARKRV